MKRNAIENMIKWNNDKTGPLFLYGFPGVGKTWLCNEYARNFRESFLYYNTNSFADVEDDDIMRFLADTFDTDERTIAETLLIFDDSEKNIGHYMHFIEYAVRMRFKWIFVSSYDYLNEYGDGEITKLRLFPLQFDEFLTAMGNEWYVETIKGHFQSKKKLPDIVHEDLLSIFEEYMWVGGMPETVNEYISLKVRINIPTKQRNAKIIAYNALNSSEERSLCSKMDQIVKSMPEQLKKNNRKFMFNIIRTGVTYQMYSDAVEELEKRGLVIRVPDYENNPKKFKLYYPEFSFNETLKNYEITDVEYMLREENYIAETLCIKGMKFAFWESGNRAELPFVIYEKGEKIPVDLKYEKHNYLKCIKSFHQQNGMCKTLKIADSNFVDEEERLTVPIYSVFCL